MNQPAGLPPDAHRRTNRRKANMTGNDTATTEYATATPPVMAVVWCRSVGTSWTLELHQLRRSAPHMTLTDWISSGVPISQPEPSEALARELLAQRGLHLFSDTFAGPSAVTRRGVGYAAADAELISLAHLVADHATEIGLHPVMLAVQWVAAGFSAEAAARWIRRGVHLPQTTRRTAPHRS